MKCGVVSLVLLVAMAQGVHAQPAPLAEQKTLAEQKKDELKRYMVAQQNARIAEEQKAKTEAKACVEAYATAHSAARATIDEIAEASLAACYEQIIAIGPSTDVAGLERWLHRFAVKAVFDRRL